MNTNNNQRGAVICSDKTILIYKNMSSVDLSHALPISFEESNGDYFVCIFIDDKDFVGQATYEQLQTALADTQPLDNTSPLWNYIWDSLLSRGSPF